MMRDARNGQEPSESGAKSFSSHLLSTITHALLIVLVVDIALNHRQRSNTSLIAVQKKTCLWLGAISSFLIPGKRVDIGGVVEEGSEGARNQKGKRSWPRVLFLTNGKLEKFTLTSIPRGKEKRQEIWNRTRREVMFRKLYDMNCEQDDRNVKMKDFNSWNTKNKLNRPIHPLGLVKQLCFAQRGSPGLHLGLCCCLCCEGGSPMRRVAELCRSAALLAQGRVYVLGLCRRCEGGLGVVPLSLLLLLFVAG